MDNDMVKYNGLRWLECIAIRRKEHAVYGLNWWMLVYLTLRFYNT
jgi:hypothetical protein